MMIFLLVAVVKMVVVVVLLVLVLVVLAFVLRPVAVALLDFDYFFVL